MNLNKYELALEFIDRYCSGDVSGLAPLLAEDLRFKGPLIQVDSRAVYFRSLRAAPPKPNGHCLLSVTENVDEVAMFYEVEKEEGTITIAQSLSFAHHKIRAILIVFDAKELSAPPARGDDLILRSFNRVYPEWSRRIQDKQALARSPEAGLRRFGESDL